MANPNYTHQWVTTGTTSGTYVPNGIYSNTPGWVSKSEYRSRLIDPRYYDQALAWDEANPKLNERQQKREKTMSTIAKIKAERQEKKERAEIEALYARYDDEVNLDGWADGTVIRFSWKPERKDAKTYTYAGIYADEHWYVTGDGLGRPRVTTEEFIDWLVEKRIRPEQIEYFGPPETVAP